MKFRKRRPASTLRVEHEDGEYVAYSPDAPHVTGIGATEYAALRDYADALHADLTTTRNGK